MGSLDSTDIKKFCSEKDIVQSIFGQKMKQQATDGGEVFSKYTW